MIAASKDAPANGSDCTRARTAGVEGQLVRKRVSISPALSTPTGRWPRSISARVSGMPLPQPASSTRDPGAIASDTASTSGTPVRSRRSDAYHSAIRSYSRIALAHRLLDVRDLDRGRRRHVLVPGVRDQDHVLEADADVFVRDRHRGLDRE